MTKQLDILFVNPGASKEIYQELSNDYSAIEPPAWALLLSQSCRNRGCSVQLIDCEAQKLNYIDAAKTIDEINPKITCFVLEGQQPSSSSQLLTGAIGATKELRKINNDIKVMFVGGYVSALPLKVLEYEEVNFIGQNESIYCLHDLLSCGDLENKLFLEKVRGLGWKDKEGHPHLNSIGSIVSQENLSRDIPGFAYDLLPVPFTNYRTSHWHSLSGGGFNNRYNFSSIFTSIGCPFKCSFCVINIVNRTDNTPGVTSDKSAVFRYWEPEFTIKQMDYLYEKGVRHLRLNDEMFILREQHFMKLCQLMAERKYDWNCWAYGRCDVTKPHHLETLKKANINFIGLGIESPNQIVRKDVIKGGYQEVKIREVIKQIRDAGINVGSNFIFGLNLDNIETMQETLDFAIDLNTEHSNFYCCVPYAGSPLYAQAVKEGWTLPDRPSAYSQHSYYFQNLPSKYLSASEILQFRDNAWTTFFTNPRYLDMIRSKFGQSEVDAILEGSKIKLKRRLLGDSEPT